MIELKRTGKCEACPAIQPEIKSCFTSEEAYFTVECKNFGLCQHLERFIAEHPYTGPEPRELDF